VPSAPVLEPHFTLPTEPFALKILGEHGRTYDVEASSDLMQWEHIVTLVSTNPITEVADPVATNLARRFYRALAH
jgi:hypothetical protein